MPLSFSASELRHHFETLAVQDVFLSSVSSSTSSSVASSDRSITNEGGETPYQDYVEVIHHKMPRKKDTTGKEDTATSGGTVSSETPKKKKPTAMAKAAAAAARALSPLRSHRKGEDVEALATTGTF